MACKCKYHRKRETEKMIKVKNMEVFNIHGAIRGMRNPHESWNLSDTTEHSLTGTMQHFNMIGDKDLELAQTLVKAGTDHSKFMRQIFVSMDITAPLYWWKEMDTYKVGTVANSESTMHRLHSKEITLSDFSIDDFVVGHDFFNKPVKVTDAFIDIIADCDRLRRMYLETKDKKYWRALIQLLPCSYNQTRTWSANYQVLRNIYHSRKGHKLSEWNKFCEYILELPYAEELIAYKGE